CAGCHSLGFPSLKAMVDALDEKGKIQFLAIQTVFEGHHANTFEKMVELQIKYKLSIPFGHDPGHVNTRHISLTMLDYRTGGTPWFIFIDQENRVLFNDFHLDVDKAIFYLEELSNIS
ncbi:MAG: TlpA family protein disulfide reductase, partial [Saprospiraceae bacterium]|nr:TlpA family protein disulfide reductase [Saprospiraceae bacterium]